MKKFLKTAAFMSLMLLLGGSYGWSQKSSIKDKAKYKLVSHNSKDGKYTWFTVYGDPLNSRIYTLKNGLTVYLTENKNAPRIYTSIPVRTGATNDPADATGLAHYLEHMLFKGTDKYGSLDYEKEKELLDQIEALYEKYRNESDVADRQELYREIDRISGEAAKFAIASEYDKMLSAIGAKGTNAYTSFEQTVYINDIPSNMLEKWLKIEGERFRNPVLRLFHTELEAVYEEKNISLDSDGRAAFTKLLEGMFPNHNYGQQTTIGTVEHLKNPSIKKIKEYYEAYYVPNNMAICLSGDLDPDKTIRLIDKYFGFYKSKPVTPYNAPEEPALTGVQEYEVVGPESELLYMGFRVPGVGAEDGPVIEMIDYLLANSAAGLIDLNLVKQQKVLRAASFAMTMRDHGVHILTGSPKEGQELEELRQLLLQQLEFIKQGEFDHNLIDAVANNMAIEQMSDYQENWARTSEFVEAFTMNQNWNDYIQRLDKINKITLEDVMRVANKYYGENYVIVYKRTGDRQDIQKVPKPEITPVEVNREAQSPFMKEVVNMESPSIEPKFLDYNNDIGKGTLNSGVGLNYVKNEENGLFELYYTLDFGTMHDPDLEFAVSYLPFLGTDKYSAEEISKRFYELGSNFNVFSSKDRVFVSLDGLDKNFEASVELFEHLLNNAKPDDKALQSLVERTLKKRSDSKLDKRTILWRGMMNYGTYGAKNPFNNVLSEAQLRALKGEALTEKIHALTSMEHNVMYYGPREQAGVETALKKMHTTPAKLTPAPKNNPYTYQNTEKTKVYFVEYDMVQAEILWLSKSVKYDPSLYASARMFNEYYGGNMSSIVFQTIRESKALAYSTFSSYRTPAKAGEPHYLQAYVGTQADKIHEAIAGMMELLNEIPKSETLFESSKAALKNKIETERITRSDILQNYQTAKRRNVTHDQRADIYGLLDNLSFSDVKDFHTKYIAGNQYNLLVMGSKENIDLKSLEQYGEVIELKLEDLYGY